MFPNQGMVAREETQMECVSVQTVQVGAARI
jgi:hypothetical protein